MLTDFVIKFTVFIFTEEDSGHVCSKLHNNIWFYLKIHIFKLKSNFLIFGFI